MRMRLALLLLLAGPVAASAGPGPGHSAGTVSSLDLMDVDVMFVGAHPDDDMGVMATFARYLLDEGWRGTVVTLTDGEGGGNATGPEAGAALGLVRREEERRALASLGVESPRFLGLPDFYFTLSAEETRARWGGRATCEVTREVRLRRPEVVVTMWPGPGTHGQHQMAARAATMAWAHAGDAAHCPEQVTTEGLKPFAPAKLYYYAGQGTTGLVEVPTTDLSPRRRMRYADLKALAIMQYRSQGYDTPQNVPAREARPESFLRVASRVPVATRETHLLEGALLPAGGSPAGVRLEVKPAAYEVAVGVQSAVDVSFRSGGVPLTDVRLHLDVPGGWAVEGGTTAPVGGDDATVTARFLVRPPPAAVTPEPVHARYEARLHGAPVGGSNPVVLQPRPAVRVSFVPLWDVAGYRTFARETATEWVIASLPTRVPVVVGRTTPVALDVVNDGPAPARGEVTLDLPPGVTLETPLRYEVAAGATSRLTARLQVTEAALPASRHAARLPLRARTSPEQVADAAELYALPMAAATRTPRTPVVDGDLSDLPATGPSIAPSDLWWRKAPAGPADLSADVRLAWDDDALYVGVVVRDDVVACNIPPDDVRSQLRSDAVGITVDPSGVSRDTSTTLQFAAFPCTTAGWGARGFRDADARPGLLEQTATGARVASRRTADGYVMEAALPWSAMPARPRPGAEIGLNVVVYDGDQENARPGANISESGLAWAAFEWGGKQALPYLWARVPLLR